MSPIFSCHCRGLLAFAALLLAGRDPVYAGAVNASLGPSSATLTHGPVVGGVTDTSAKVFARTNEPAQLAVRYSRSPSLDGALTTNPQAVSGETDFTGILLLNGLSPNTTYYYTVLVNGQDQLLLSYPSFRTFPPSHEALEFRVAVIGDTGNQGTGEPHGMGEAFGSAGREQALLMVQTGDFDHQNPKTLEEKRSVRKDLYDPLVSADFVALTRTMPFFYVWDDHDFGGNNSNGRASFKSLSLKVYKEYVPSADLANPAAGIWQKFRVGQAEFFLLDSRSQRSRDQEPDDEGKSMLDAFRIPNGQKQWLKDSLLASTAVWKIVVSSSVWNPTLAKGDSWSSFQAEQQELLRFFEASDIRNIVILSGDVHWGAIDDGTHGGVPQLVVPNMNMTRQHQGRYGSVWSNGTWGIPQEDGIQNGYGKLTFLTNPHRLLLEVKSKGGTTQLELMITASIP